MAMPNQLKKCGKISATVKKKAAAGVPVQEIFASIQNYQNAPKSLTTFYKYYRDDMDEARGNITEQIANKLIQKALEGDDYKAQELWLTTKGGWSKNQNVNVFDTTDKLDEHSSAKETLLSKLGLIENKDDK